MELAEYIRLARKWFWLIFLVAVLAGGVSFLIRSQQQAIYQADAMISVGGYIESPNPNTTEISTGEQLAQTYAVLAKTYTILNATIEAGDYPLEPTALEEIVSTSILTDTSLLVLSVQYFDPVLAADIANDLAQQLILNSPSNLTPEQQTQITLAEEEISKLIAELANLREQVVLVDSQIEEAVFPSQLESLQEQRANLVDQINQSSANLAQFTDTISSLQQRTNSLNIVEPARIPEEPIGTSVFMATLLGGIVGVALAAGVVLLIEYLDDTIKTSEQVTGLLNLPVLGAIAKFGKANSLRSDQLVAFREPSSPIAESYRQLRTNLFFSVENKATKIYIVTSPGPEDGKSITVANLAVVMAAAGMKVLLVDADLRRPMQHQIFGLKNEVGLTTLLTADPQENINPQEALQQGGGYAACLQDTEIPRLRVITSGFLPSNPSEILGTVVMQHWVKAFSQASNVDVVIFDTPPILVVSDSSILAAATMAEVILVLRAGKTRRNGAALAYKQLQQLNLTVKGVVLNDISSQDMGSDYGYGYYYYGPDGQSKNGHSAATTKNLGPRIAHQPKSRN